MADPLPARLLGHIDGQFFVFDPRESSAPVVTSFDIVSYVWGPRTPPYNHGIANVTWDVPITKEKLDDIKNLMVSAGIQYLWADCVCINQADAREKSVEIVKMFEYYKNARKCHILLHMDRVWNPQEIVDHLRFLDHILSHMQGAALASEARLTENMIARLRHWELSDWAFSVDKSVARSAAVELGVLNCYSSCINFVRGLFHNLYFSRVWTFQEMLLGKNITMWGVNDKRISALGELGTWMDLATDATDKAYKLQAWIEMCRVLQTGSVNAILGSIQEDRLSLDSLRMQVRGINSARTDIINGGPYWWYENQKGISNIFSAISLTSRSCERQEDLFKGLLGVFSGLFTPEEVERLMPGDDMEKVAFAFFRQLSLKTGIAWTRLAISSGERGSWDWIPVSATSTKLNTTDCFAGVVNLGLLKPKEGLVKTSAWTGISGTPHKYMRILLTGKQTADPYSFVFRGCNCGKSISTGFWKTEAIPTHEQPRYVVKDETGRMLVQCATILGSLFDPGCHLASYRRRLLWKLQPKWHISDPNAKPRDWVDRCVSGTFWENPDFAFFKSHNMSMNYQMPDVFGFESRLENESTANISCEVRAKCGCMVIAPFSLIMAAMTSVEGCSLGAAAAALDNDGRIILQDGLGLVQVGDVGKTFKLVAFGGEVRSLETHARSCRSVKQEKPVTVAMAWPRGRALVREEFTHEMMDVMRDYGYVQTGGSGNLLIARNHPLEHYKIIGVCLDEVMESKKGCQKVNIR